MARIYEFKDVVVLPLDGVAYDMSEAIAFLAPAPVAVYAEGEDRVVGSAILRETDAWVLADISIDYESESRLLAETGTDLWVHALGRIHTEARRLAPVPIDLNAPVRVLGVDVEALMISLRRPFWDGARPLGGR